MLTLFTDNHRYGLRRGTVTVLAAAYDAVWPLPYSFWGYRRGECFGVVAVDGVEVSSCELPAVYTGFAQLSVDEELEAILEPEATFVPFMRQRFPALQLHYDQLCQPTCWLAEVVTPHLADEEGELRLYAADRCLVLKPDGSWEWLKRAPRVRDPQIYYLRQYSAATFEPVVPAEFVAPEAEALLRWRLRLTELTEDTEELDASSAFSWTLTDVAMQNTHFDALDEVLTSSGIRSLKPVEGVDIPFYIPFDIARVAPDVRQACEAQLNTIFEVDADSRVYVDQLIYLAWLWANDFVFYDAQAQLHEVDGRYEFANGWFDNQLIDSLYWEYCLDKLVPLLREPAAGAM